MLAASLSGAAGQPRPARDAEDFTHWPSVAAVRLDGNAGAARWAEFELTNEVFAHARRGLGDLRLTDASGTVLPYVLRSTAPLGQANEPPASQARLIDLTRRAGEYTTVLADFGQAVPKNRVEVLTAGTSFVRRVAIQASPDGNSWRMLRPGGWVFRVDHPNGACSKTAVDVPESDDRYLRVTVFPDKGNANAPAVEAVTAQLAEPAPRSDLARVDVAPEAMTVWGKIYTVHIDVDLGAEKLPLRRIEFPVTGAWLLRRVEVLGRDHETIAIQGPRGIEQVEDPWRSLGGQMLYRLDANGAGADGAASAPPEERLGIDLADGCRYLRLIVRSHSADPDELAINHLGLPRIFRARCYAAFRAAGPGPYKLYMGNLRATAPQYDLAAMQEELRAAGAARARLEGVTPNPSYVAAAAGAAREVPFTEKNRPIIWAAIALLSLAVVLMVRRQMRKARRTFARPTREEDFHNL